MKLIAPSRIMCAIVCSNELSRHDKPYVAYLFYNAQIRDDPMPWVVENLLRAYYDYRLVVKIRECIHCRSVREAMTGTGEVPPQPKPFTSWADYIRRGRPCVKS